MSIDVTDATFAAEVLDRSAQVPVVVDFWAAWCGPCRQLGPILEQAVDEQQGRVVLAKVDVDRNPRVAGSLGVQGIPAVFAFRDGRPVDSFVGAQGAREVRAFVEGLLPTAAEQQLAALVAEGSEASLRAALELDADHEPAIVALAELLIGDGRAEEALALLAKVPETAATRRLSALARQGSVGDVDVEARLGHLLEQVKGDDAARAEFLDLLELLGPDDPRTAGWRKQLTARLF